MRRGPFIVVVGLLSVVLALCAAAFAYNAVQPQRMAHGITVNGVAPTFVNTEMIQHVYARPEFREAILARIPLGRIADPKDVVGAALFFASPAAGFVTGQVLYVDGGITASQ